MVHRRDRPGLTAITESSPEVCPCSLPGKQGRVRSSDSAWQSHWHWHRQLAGDQNCTDKNRSCQAAGCILRPGPGQVNGTGTRNLKPAERRPCPCTVQSRSESDGRRPGPQSRFWRRRIFTTRDPGHALQLEVLLGWTGNYVRSKKRCASANASDSFLQVQAAVSNPPGSTVNMFGHTLQPVSAA